MANEKKLLSARDVALILRISPELACKVMRQEALTEPGEEIRVELSALRRWIETRQNPCTQPL